MLDEKIVWRYMDFSKFISMLKEKSLYFTSAKNFSDPFEGAIGLADRQKEWDDHYLDFFRRAVSSAPIGYPTPKLSAEKIESEAHRLLKSIKAASSEVRNALVSCWHENDDESEALWQLYCPKSGPGLAIRTTVGNLWDATSDAGHAVVGRVKYVDFSKSYATIQNEWIFCKRQSLSHEREVRVVIQNYRENPVSGLQLPCDLDGLIAEIVVSPFAPRWFMDVLESTIEKFGYSFEVRPSSISDRPFY